MENNVEEKKKKTKKELFKEIVPYIIILIIVLLVKTYLIAPIQVNGSSMMTTLHNNDIMILNKIHYRFNDIKRFDIVVVKYNNKYIIKRVIGLPGESIEYKDNKLYINGKYYKEEFLDNNTKTKDFNLEEVIGKNEIPEGHYFVMGDNREDSLDSRIVGTFTKKQIKGKTKLTILPFNRIGNKK